MYRCATKKIRVRKNYISPSILTRHFCWDSNLISTLSYYYIDKKLKIKNTDELKTYEKVVAVYDDNVILLKNQQYIGNVYEFHLCVECSNYDKENEGETKNV